MPSEPTKKPWGGRFTKETDVQTEAFTESASCDQEPAPQSWPAAEGIAPRGCVNWICGALRKERAKLRSGGAVLQHSPLSNCFRSKNVGSMMPIWPLPSPVSNDFRGRTSNTLSYSTPWAPCSWAGW